MSSQPREVTVFQTVCDVCDKVMYYPSEPMDDATDKAKYYHSNKLDAHKGCVDNLIEEVIAVRNLKSKDI